MGAALDLATDPRGADTQDTGAQVGVDGTAVAFSQERCARIGLFPQGARATRARLFDALEHAYPIRFEEIAFGDGGVALGDLDGLLVIGAERPAELPPGLPCLQALGEERTSAGATASVTLGLHPSLARALRGAQLTDRWTNSLPAQALGAGQVTLASVDGAPAWVLVPAATELIAAAPDGAATELVAATPEAATPHAATPHAVMPDAVMPHAAPAELVSAAPAELAPGEALRERLAPERCLALLALVHFVRHVAGDRSLQAPLDAAFVLDDPNLHWPRYGHVRYAELARHAQEHGYHMVIAMPPIDGWLAHPRAVGVFREHPAQLSLCVHGDDHLGPELGRIRSPSEGRALADRALVRAAAFQRRTGIPYERVMVPPHEQLTEDAAYGLFTAGFASVCVSRPYPWIAPTRPGAAAALSAGPRQRGALAGWGPRELVAGGLPVLLRTGFNAPREDLVLRAFLGQPLILYGHHDLLADGLDILADSTAAINALGDVRWGSLATITSDKRGVARETQTPAMGEAPTPVRCETRAPRPQLRPLLRRLASEARDRTRV